MTQQEMSAVSVVNVVGGVILKTNIPYLVVVSLSYGPLNIGGR